MALRMRTLYLRIIFCVSVSQTDGKTTVTCRMHGQVPTCYCSGSLVCPTSKRDANSLNNLTSSRISDGGQDVYLWRNRSEMTQHCEEVYDTLGWQSGDNSFCRLHSMDSLLNHTVLNCRGSHKNTGTVFEQYLNSLQIYDCPVGLIEESALSSSRHTLMDLRLSGNKLSNRVWDFIRLFNNLEYLRLVQNYVSEIPQTTFQRMTKLKRIFLHSNSILVIEPGTFTRPGDVITDLDLDNNNITSIQPWTFSGAVVTLLSLSQNPLDVVFSNAFSGLRVEHLQLSSAKLSNLPGDTFHNMTGIKKLGIPSNRLNSTDWLTPEMCRSVQVDLIKNDFTHFPSNETCGGQLDLPAITLGQNRLANLDLTNFTVRESASFENNHLNTISGVHVVSNNSSVPRLMIFIQDNFLSFIPFIHFSPDKRHTVCIADLANNQLMAVPRVRIEWTGARDMYPLNIKLELFTQSNNLEVLHQLDIHILPSRTFPNEMILVRWGNENSNIRRFPRCDVFASDTYRLFHLNLNGNMIESVHLGTCPFSIIIETLWLSENQIRSFTISRLANWQIKVLVLSKNRLSELPKDIFCASFSVTGMDLEDNRISTLPTKCASNTELIVLRVAGNPVYCTCAVGDYATLLHFDLGSCLVENPGGKDSRITMTPTAFVQDFCEISRNTTEHTVSPATGVCKTCFSAMVLICVVMWDLTQNHALAEVLNRALWW